jgi:hypothetical protein
MRDGKEAVDAPIIRISENKIRSSEGKDAAIPNVDFSVIGNDEGSVSLFQRHVPFV